MAPSPRSSRSPPVSLQLNGSEIAESRYGTLLPADMPMINKIRQITRNRKNRNLAIPAAAAAIPVNPKTAATSAMIRKIKAQRSILSPPSEAKSHASIAARVSFLAEAQLNSIWRSLSFLFRFSSAHPFLWKCDSKRSDRGFIQNKRGAHRTQRKHQLCQD